LNPANRGRGGHEQSLRLLLNDTEQGGEIVEPILRDRNGISHRVIRRLDGLADRVEVRSRRLADRLNVVGDLVHAAQQRSQSGFSASDQSFNALLCALELEHNGDDHSCQDDNRERHDHDRDGRESL
jgi:hypothetical protein